MIRIIGQGTYELSETKRGTKILILNKRLTYAWITVQDIGEILITSQKHHPRSQILTLGKYRIYRVKDEPGITDLIHLELLVGEGRWQGYLLPLGLPTKEDKRHRIIPTAEIITRSVPIQEYL